LELCPPFARRARFLNTVVGSGYARRNSTGHWEKLRAAHNMRLDSPIEVLRMCTWATANVFQFGTKKHRKMSETAVSHFIAALAGGRMNDKDGVFYFQMRFSSCGSSFALD
jgi:hypothetical protein